MQMDYSKEKNYAGFWVRLAAYFIDSGIILIGLFVIQLGWLLASDSVRNTNLLFQYTMEDVSLYLSKVAYFVLLTWRTGTTVGKRLMNIQVVPSNPEQKLSFIDTLYRETVGRYLCGLSIFVGYIIIGIDKEKCGFHDMLCDTRVIYAKKVKIYPQYQNASYSLKKMENSYSENTIEGSYRLVTYNKPRI